MARLDPRTEGHEGHVEDLRDPSPPARGAARLPGRTLRGRKAARVTPPDSRRWRRLPRPLPWQHNEPGSRRKARRAGAGERVGVARRRPPPGHLPATAGDSAGLQVARQRQAPQAPGLRSRRLPPAAPMET